MTPEELRRRGWQPPFHGGGPARPRAFRRCGLPCGYCIELALKARYCTRNGWPDFPNDRAEARRRRAACALLAERNIRRARTP